MYPKVSVLCVSYNRPLQLKNTIRFFNWQTWPNKEFILVDDSDQDKRIDLSAFKDVQHITTGQRDCGLKHDIALDAAQGDIVCYQDDDDYFSPLRIEKEIEPLLDRRADVTGLPREYILRFPESSFWKMKPDDRRPKGEDWIGNGARGFKWGAIHDNTAMFGRWAFSKVNRHAHGPIGQKVGFLNSLWSWGRKLEIVRNDGLFIYVRHAKNSWQFKEHEVLEPVKAPEWVSQQLIAEMAEANAKDHTGVLDVKYP
jgi:glycosyltransferase involved in cell wall biosynthesis